MLTFAFVVMEFTFSLTTMQIRARAAENKVKNLSEQRKEGLDSANLLYFFDYVLWLNGNT